MLGRRRRQQANVAYWIGGALAGFPVASIVVSGLITTVLIGLVYWIDRHRRGGAADPRPTTEPAAHTGSDAGAD